MHDKFFDKILEEKEEIEELFGSWLFYLNYYALINGKVVWTILPKDAASF